MNQNSSKTAVANKDTDEGNTQSEPKPARLGSSSNQSSFVETIFGAINISKDLNARSNEAIKNAWVSCLESMATNITYQGSRTTDVRPFSIKISGENTIMYLPANWKKLIEHPTWSIILVLLNALNYTLEECTTDISVVPHNDNDRLFWAGFLNRVSRAPLAMQHIKLTTGSPQETGKACADVEALLKFSKVPGIETLLPEKLKSGYMQKKLLTSRITELGGLKGDKEFIDLHKRVAEAINSLLTMHEAAWKQTVASYKIPFAEVISKITRKRETTVGKGRNAIKSSKPIHLSKPSTWVEAMLDFDKNVLSSLDEPWKNLKELAEQFAEGVPIDRVEEVKEAYKGYYELQFNNTEKCAGWRAARRELISVGLVNIGKKNTTYTSKLRSEVLTSIVENAMKVGASQKEIHTLDSLSPYHLKVVDDALATTTLATRATSLLGPLDALVNILKNMTDVELDIFKRFCADLDYGPFNEKIQEAISKVNTFFDNLNTQKQTANVASVSTSK